MAAFQLLAQLEQQVVLIIIGRVRLGTGRGIAADIAGRLTLMALAIAALEQDRGVFDPLGNRGRPLPAAITAVIGRFRHCPPVTSLADQILRLQRAVGDNAAECTGTSAA